MIFTESATEAESYGDGKPGGRICQESRIGPFCRALQQAKQRSLDRG